MTCLFLMILTAGGVLEEELEYTKEVHNQGEEASAYSIQIFIQTGQDTSSIESLKLHAETAVKATQVKVVMYNQ